MTTVDEVRDRLDVVEIIGEHVELKRAGRSYKGLCPFHDEKTPSFVVFPDSGAWRCFGACGTGGDVFDFVMRFENLSFREALELLARRAGVDLDPPTQHQAQRQERRARLKAAVAAARDFFADRLRADPTAEAAREYLARRRFDDDAAHAAGLGWSPDEWRATADHLLGLGFDEDELLAAGLVRARDGGGFYDAFRGRLMFPISDVRGDPIGFGARTLDPEGVPKYINSPQGDLFDKGRTLYGLDRARHAIRHAGEAVVVEGYTDVVRAHAAGFANVVASLGTALTEHHVMLLKRFAPRIVLALDADAAGQAATRRGLDVASSAAAGDLVPVVTARGLRYEQRLDVELRVATLPAGQDPDDVIRDDPAAWERAIAGARPVMEYLFDALTRDLDLSDPTGKLEAVERLTPSISEVTDPVARAAWVARLSDLVRIDERAIAQRLARAGGGSESRRGRGAQAGTRTPSSLPSLSPSPGRAVGRREAAGSDDDQPWPIGAEEGPDDPTAGDGSTEVEDLGEGMVPASPPALALALAPPSDRATWLLGHLLLDPTRLVALGADLAQDALAPLSDADFPRAIERDLLEAVHLASRGAPPPDAPPEHRLEALPDTHAGYAAELRRRAASEPRIDSEAMRRALRAAVIRIRERALLDRLFELKSLQAEAEAQDELALDARVVSAGAELRRLKSLLNATAADRARQIKGKRDKALG